MRQTSQPLFSALPHLSLVNSRTRSGSPPCHQPSRTVARTWTHKFLSLVLVGAFTLASGCASDGSDKSTIGAITGAVIGGVIGNQIGSGSGRTLATGAGVLLGALAGSRIGRYLQEQDRMEQAKATAEALDNGDQNEVDWRNPDSGVKGTVEAEPIIVDQQANQQCRVVKQTVQLSDGQTMDENLKFCRVPGDEWALAT